MEYIDFNVKIGPRVAENQYAVAARSQAIGETRGVFVQPLSDEQLELFVLKVGLARRGVRRIQSPEWRAAQEFGQKLFRSLFTDEIRAAYLASHNDAVRQDKGLRVKLTLDAPELANYPWEFLYDPSSSQFLSLFEDTPILRYIELPRPILPLAVAPPLRILAVASSPKDFEPLDLARERRNLSLALDSLLQAGMLELDWLPTASLDALRAQLLKRAYHIFHFIGHGGFDNNEQDGILIFENAQQYANRVSGERLAVILGNHRTLRLAMLNACEGARTSEQDPFAGTAMTLVRTANLPAVIAMQFEITDRAAIDFATGFYGAIAAGRAVDAAVSQGRQAIFASNNDVEWSTPVLYLRANDGIIFQVDSIRAAQAEQERAAREKEAVAAAAALAETERLEQERVAREQVEAERATMAEQERVAQERAAREKRDAELVAAALTTQQNLDKEKLEQARAVQAQSNSARSIDQPRPESIPEARELSKPISSTQQPPYREAVDFGQVRLPFLLAQVIWVLAMGFFVSTRETTDNLLFGILFALALMGILFWWGRGALSPRANQILLVGMGVGFAVQIFALFLFVKPLGDALYENVNPALGALPAATNDFIIAALRSGFFALIGGGAGLAVMARQTKNANEAESVAPSPEETSTPEIVERVQALPTRTLYIIAGIFMALSFSTTSSSFYALFYGASDDLPQLKAVGIFAGLASVLFATLGAYALGLAIANQIKFNRTAFIVFAIGSIAAALVKFSIAPEQFDTLVGFPVTGLLIGGSLAFGLRLSNSELSWKMLGLVAAGWVIGATIQGITVNSLYPSVSESVWEWLLPLEQDFGYKLLLVLQVGIIAVFIGLIAPVVGIGVLDWQLRQTKQK